ncbi:MAG: hypothetical protein F4Y14_22340 [Acidobacteria bacterium]|nr:hypothetical protein [Acidobacteriota bacterium]
MPANSFATAPWEGPATIASTSPGGSGLERAAHVGRSADPRRGVEGPVGDLVVADGERVVAERIVGVDDEGPFRDVGGDSALEGVARVQQQHGAPVGRPRRAQVAQVPAQQRDASLAVVREDAAVQVGGADDGKRDAVDRAVLIRRGNLLRRRRPREQNADGHQRGRGDNRPEQAPHGGILPGSTLSVGCGGRPRRRTHAVAFRGADF